MTGVESRRRPVSALGAGTAVFLVACGGDDSRTCSVDALASARPGTVIRLGACRLESEASIVIRSGVQVRGVGPRETILDVDELPLFAEPGSAETPTRFSNLTIRTSSIAMFSEASSGGGVLVLEDVVFEVERGIGLWARRLERLDLNGVEVVGSLSGAEADSFTGDPDPAKDPAFGILLQEVGGEEGDRLAARLDDVSVSSIAGHGLLALNSDVELTGGRMSNVMNMVMGIIGPCRAQISDTVLRDGPAGLRGTPTIGLFGRGGAQIRTEATSIDEVEGVGLLQEDGEAVHEGLQIRDNDRGGAWFRGTSEVVIDESGGAMSRVTENRFSGVLFDEVGRVDVARLEVLNTVSSNLFLPDVPTIGDGVQVIGANTLLMERVSVRGSGRAGLVVDLRGRPADDASLSFTEVEIEAPASAIGAKLQNFEEADVPPEWDRGIMRRGGVTRESDNAAEPLDTVPPGVADFENTLF